MMTEKYLSSQLLIRTYTTTLSLDITFQQGIYVVSELRECYPNQCAGNTRRNFKNNLIKNTGLTAESWQSRTAQPSFRSAKALHHNCSLANGLTSSLTD